MHPPEMLYIGRSRLHRNRANLIQTLHTVSAFVEIGISTELLLPPWHRMMTPEKKLSELGIKTGLNVTPIQLLHRRWPLSLFPRVYKRRIEAARAVYVRSAEISLALARFNIRHQLEIHTLRPLQRAGNLERIIRLHRQGIIGHLIPISHTTANSLIRKGADPERIHISPSGVNLAAYRAIPPFDGLPLTTMPKMVYLGRISSDRGLGILSALAEQGAGEVLMVGEVDGTAQKRRNLITRPPVPHRDIPSIYAKADLVLLPYQPDLEHADGISPLKLFEAMAAGRPIIASDLPPIREILKDGVNALLVNPDDPMSWMRAVETLQHNPDLAVRIARKAHTEASRYDWKTRAGNIADALGLRQTPTYRNPVETALPVKQEPEGT